MPIVDVSFGLHGDHIPVDHGYHLLSAVSEQIPEIHGDREVGLHPVAGRFLGNRLMALTRQSRLTIRVSSDRIAQVLPLAGKVLRVGEGQVRVGVPQTHSLVPSARLYSRLVIIKGFMEPDSFLDAAKRQLEDLKIKGKLFLVEQPEVARSNKGRQTGSRSPYLRRTIRIRDKEVVGFALRAEELTAEESIRLQEEGIGGRRRFGCGIFIPDRK
jgi:CRISPR-associated protein Cas6